MDPWLQQMQEKLGNNEDFFMLKDFLADAPVCLLGFKSIIDVSLTQAALHEHISKAISANQSIDELMKVLGEVKEKAIAEAVASIVMGKLVIYFENQQQFIIVEPTTKSLNRLYGAPSNENVLQGPTSSLMEEIDHNVGSIRKQLPSNKLRVQSFQAGRDQQKKLALLYMEGHVDMDLVNTVKRQIETNLHLEINNLQNLSRTLGFSSWGAMSKYNITEMPQEAAYALRKGKIVLLLDRMPFALILPSLLWDMFALENDHNYPHLLMIIIRFVRVIGILVTLLIPGLYVALVAVNPEVLRIEMALSIAQSRSGIPYPALVEMILMLVIMELIIEASVRLPKSIGPTLTMVGGIILGQAVVTAQLVSSLLIIVLAATTIANSTVVGFQNSLSVRLFKYVIVILSSIYGVLGMLAGLVFMGTYMASISTFGISYLHFTRKKDEISRG
ncbi:spore germination protein [Paenibacillus agricola]|uniref:Spore germination protein n=1 Tax=Paenibacillus agricola TaxID=2716264 RepID=A0ABX0J6U9_9BACL|nr:spore germination protein [Paenibacillus agricola]NHN31688.1 spore germination protein [Paenibacillus agricola]